MQRARNGGAAAPAVGRRIVDFEFALAAEAADNVDFPAHLGHRHLGAGGGHWGADDPTADTLGEGHGSEHGAAGKQHAAEKRDEVAAPHYSITSSATASSEAGMVSPSIRAICATHLTFRPDLARRLPWTSEHQTGTALAYVCHVRDGSTGCDPRARNQMAPHS